MWCRLAAAQVRIAFSAGLSKSPSTALMLTVFAIIYMARVMHADLAIPLLFLFILLRLNQKAKDFNGGVTLSALVTACSP